MTVYILTEAQREFPFDYFSRAFLVILFLGFNDDIPFLWHAVKCFWILGQELPAHLVKLIVCSQGQKSKILNKWFSLL